MCFTIPLNFFLLYSTSQDMNQRALDSPHWRPNQTFLHLTPPPSKLLLFWLLRPSNITPVPYALVSYPAVCAVSCELQSRNEISKEKETKRKSPAAISRFLLQYHCLESLNSLILAHVQLNDVIHFRILT